MKRLTELLLFTLITASLILTACSGPTTAPATETPTQASQPTQAVPTAAPATNTPAPTASPLPTSTQLSTNTPLPTEISTATQPPAASTTPTIVGTPANTPAAVPSGQTAVVNENTNCRTGPSADYELVYTFLSGDTAKIVSKTTEEGYVLVENPNNPGQSCWLWTQYVTISGDLSSLPVATAPPPLVNFTLDFTRIQICGGFILEFKVVNTGTKTIQAYTLVAKDLTSHTQQTSSSSTFDYVEGCFIQQEIGWVDPGKTGYVYAPGFSYDPTGHSFEATVTICSHNDMSGVCVTEVLKFTPK